ncbi:MAG: pantoate kinase [Halobacteriota archaeon]|nr:pantoate kinase [Halobacteriota archaeon]
MVKAYAPSHITGFFEIVEDSDPAYMGSRGCGMALSSGCETEVVLGKKDLFLINGEEADALTTAYVVERLANEPVEISSSYNVPVGGGFGASGSGALSSAYALNALFSLGMSLEELGKVAHLAEVENRTGLGDVIAQMHGGIVIRREPGAPGIGVVDDIPTGDIEVGYVVLGSLSTKVILEDPRMIREINAHGRAALKELLKVPTLNNFMGLSKRFAIDTGLISEKARDAVEAVEEGGGLASMAMLGDVVFAVGNFEPLSDFGEVGVSSISCGGARLL